MIDDIDRAILELLAGNSRLSLKDLAARIQLSSPSTSERLKRLEERGIIRGYTIDADPRLLGHQLQAIVRIRPLPGRLPSVQKLIEATAEIVECDKVTGEDCFVARLFVRSMEHLDEVVDRIAEEATTNTAIVKGQLIKRRLPPITY
ncbi:Lrp/AsnC family transcriptional regulator [Dyella mobilis]|uniref:Lrp/AsnC family transcriptional regulator n=1 Tax=Dyella mobilis TaxID=1849582 RepID=A0ABS2KCN8_9GAMM|nr:Lrp/AsnC family transcriptional regulator [Dyella mobilis]MBM7128810.1 Lrp/AsnC family transcriptional regulator [Dyella mobilis]GLQ99142.1 AsnC family transcriptional regulator [Dyella mobilis]